VCEASDLRGLLPRLCPRTIRAEGTTEVAAEVLAPEQSVVPLLSALETLLVVAGVERRVPLLPEATFECAVDDTVREFPRVVDIRDDIGPDRLAKVAVGEEAGRRGVVQQRLEFGQVVIAGRLGAELGREAFGVDTGVDQPLGDGPPTCRSDDSDRFVLAGDRVDALASQQVCHLLDSVGAVFDVAPAVLQHERDRICVAAGDDLRAELFECRELATSELVVENPRDLAALRGIVGLGGTFQFPRVELPRVRRRGR